MLQAQTDQSGQRVRQDRGDRDAALRTYSREIDCSPRAETLIGEARGAGRGGTEPHGWSALSTRFID